MGVLMRNRRLQWFGHVSRGDIGIEQKRDIRGIGSIGVKGSRRKTNKQMGGQDVIGYESVKLR